MSSENYVYKKEVDWSLLNYGFAIPLEYQVIFKQIAGRFLERGESKPIKLYLNGKPYDAKLQNNRIDPKFGNRADIVQIRYSRQSEIANALRGTFQRSYLYMQKIKQMQEKGSKNRIILPEEYREYIAVYTTEYDDSYLIETIVSEDINVMRDAVQGKAERMVEAEINYENVDEGAGIRQNLRLVKIRKLNRKIGENLKLMYGYRCQLCGQLIGEEFGSHLAEAHHIDYFIKSLKNDESKGFYVRNYRIDSNSPDIFPVVRPVTGDVIRIGTIYGENVGASIPISSMYSHTFVTGATRTGKTTTVKKIIKELNDRDIPALVIEAAKKEYIQLLPMLPNLRILTPGNDGQQLYFNPLQVEDGTLIENHIDAVVRAITAATAGEHPIPEALEGLLRQTYKQAGWEYGTMAYTDKEKPFPTFRAVFENIPEYISNHARYGPEVRQNLEGALTLRMENLYTGSLGRTFSRAFGITAKELLGTPTVIELADFSDSGTEFLMNMLLFKLHGYLSRLSTTSSLKQVIVVEEAHNIFRATLSEDNGRARNNEYFEKMLAEISASGTGMILCDQRPSIMSDAVMANTSERLLLS